MLEVVPLTLLDARCLGLRSHDARTRDDCGKAFAIPHKWTFYFLMAVGFWNFVGAGMFGFLINLPIVSYLRDRHAADPQPWPRGPDRRLRHAGDRADGVCAPSEQR